MIGRIFSLPNQFFSLNAVDGTWGACDDPWGCYITDPSVAKEPIGHHGTTWVPVSWGTWENYNVEGVPTGKEGY
ncbi:hypothetical protein GUITHDRAFT_116677 [Guillardia theta CCMP2712]|uniref:Uncharacterized protein n=1 Tax=Guillardia theta (strain CCMP2712) TaxID=905079 RepID=L1IMR0_GUITC|nr:hypothetical protein GUITHDRAFT_116677 [Guillardia theta CCMP2712]EKX37100.1 hypothetical protein GUITHDRAFT_116677 [Guillardia theta CCMP2712]|eukprot:XP_005824080.1 hypothetical protein GUITHDRAFT_116677 [Guillardia theta CCMP2712]